MSYNITRWRVHEIVDLKVRAGLLDPSPDMIRRGWGNDVTFDDDGCVCTYGDTARIVGHLNIRTEIFTITELDIHGEGSGTLWNEVISKALDASSGYLRATAVWEGGDEIQEIEVQDGYVTTRSLL